MHKLHHIFLSEVSVPVSDSCPKHPFLYGTILWMKRHDCFTMGVLISPLKYILRLQKGLSRKHQAIYRKCQENVLLTLLVALKLMECRCQKFLTDGWRHQVTLGLYQLWQPPCNFSLLKSAVRSLALCLKKIILSLDRINKKKSKVTIFLKLLRIILIVSTVNFIFIFACMHVPHICHLKKHPQCQKMKANDRHAEKVTSSVIIQCCVFITWSILTHDSSLPLYKDGLHAGK